MDKTFLAILTIGFESPISSVSPDASKKLLGSLEIIDLFIIVSLADKLPFLLSLFS
jgi:hypothetical protein